MYYLVFWWQELSVSVSDRNRTFTFGAWRFTCSVGAVAIRRVVELRNATVWQQFEPRVGLPAMDGRDGGPPPGAVASTADTGGLHPGAKVWVAKDGEDGTCCRAERSPLAGGMRLLAVPKRVFAPSSQLLSLGSAVQ